DRENVLVPMSVAASRQTRRVCLSKAIAALPRENEIGVEVAARRPLFLVARRAVGMLVLYRHRAVRPDRRGQRALKASLKVEYEAPARNRARHLDETLVGRAESVALRRARLQRRRAGRRLLDEPSGLGIDKGLHARCVLGNIRPGMRSGRLALFGSGRQ